MIGPFSEGEGDGKRMQNVKKSERNRPPSGFWSKGKVVPVLN
jgi:hypothetical protein